MVAQVPPRKYRIERYLAEGGMGAIYVGKKIGAGGFEKEVVLKQLLPEFTSRAEFRDLFFREAKISATLDHQNIVRTFDLVKADDRLFIVMEYVRGADLRSISWRARRKRPLSPRAILHVALEILAGLAYAHTRRSPSGEPLGIIHRDLSPSNILCSGEGEVKLSDFGIAKAVTYSSAFYRVRGKVGYMSPEMARSQPIDARSDLFSLGVSTYETLIGERVYAGDLNTPADHIYAQVVPSLASRCPGLPAALQGVLDKALALNRDDRYESAEAFAGAIRQVARAHGLLYSAPQLAAELRELLGPNSESWLGEESDPGHAHTARPPAPPAELAGHEASVLSADEVVPSPPALRADRSPTPPTIPPLLRLRQPPPAPAADSDPLPSPPAAPGMVRPSQPAAAAAGARSSSTLRALHREGGSPKYPGRGGVATLRARRPFRGWALLGLLALGLLAIGVLLASGCGVRPARGSAAHAAGGAAAAPAWVARRE